MKLFCCFVFLFIQSPIERGRVRKSSSRKTEERFFANDGQGGSIGNWGAPDTSSAVECLLLWTLFVVHMGSLVVGGEGQRPFCEALRPGTIYSWHMLHAQPCMRGVPILHLSGSSSLSLPVSCALNAFLPHAHLDFCLLFKVPLTKFLTAPPVTHKEPVLCLWLGN